MKLYYVYILKCSDNSYYIGITNNVDQRVAQHNEGYDHQSYTYTRRPVELVYSEMFTEVLQAIAREKQIKKWSRIKKEALIKERWEQLNGLAACNNESTHQNYNPPEEKAR